ncbi:MAG: elongation factor P maturation arginine rhamnosyltransferase EarP [Nitrosomonas sp.]|nr:elongation factor P maturation arginine rhamnosyltransferase EarP [Nitrosomonas sp.]MDP1950772.1 elongation factor P maturation arginine rhamnosyltransferase EarP [Nitrosomonas sp.]
MKQHWDIFCTVVDNYGDIGICWRLARELVSRHQLTVRLWVDDMVTFSHIAPNVNFNKSQQWLNGVEIRYWSHPFEEGIKPADVVIEAFACKLPESYMTVMAELPLHPVWINLEYLSAENWVANYHCLPSPHPYLSLVKYFFFPGFSLGTGGLLRTKHHLSDKNIFDDKARSKFLQQLNVRACMPSELRISLFCYDTAPLNELLTAWSKSTASIHVMVPQGSIAKVVGAYFHCSLPKVGTILHKGKLTVQFIPFLEQSEYDQLLRCCDFNFIRGEDSFVSAQWSARPFVWHIYPQADNAHQVKLESFLDLYTAKMIPSMAAAVRAFWLSWNNNDLISETWPDYLAFHMALKQYGDNWVRQLNTHTDLASNLVQFAENQI